MHPTLRDGAGAGDGLRSICKYGIKEEYGYPDSLRDKNKGQLEILNCTTMSWFYTCISVIIGFFAIYVVKRLILRSKVDIKENCVLITGCDSGFGRETAIRLDKMGVCVLATCLTKEGEQSLKSATSDKLKTFQMDVTNSQQIKDVYEEVERQIPRDTGKLIQTYSNYELIQTYSNYELIQTYSNYN